MNYQNIYNSIIEKAKSQNRIKLRKNQRNYVYYEKHHIIPKCLNGSNDNSNLVLLTAREHFICHKLLTYIYKGNRKIIFAYTLLCFKLQNISSRDYKHARELISKNTSGKNHYLYGKKQSKETINKRMEKNKLKIEQTRKKISNSLKGHIVDEKTKLKISESNKGKKKSDLHRLNLIISHKGHYQSLNTKMKISEKMKNIRKGKPSNMLGKKHSEFTKQKMSISAKNRIDKKYKNQEMI